MTDTNLSPAAATALALFILTFAPLAQAQDEAEPAYDVAQVTQGGFDAHATMQGRYTADKADDIRFDAERYSGELKVAEVLVSHGKVDAGQVVLKLEAPDLDEELTDAREALGKAKLRYEWAQKEAQIAAAERAVAAERRKLSLADTLSAHQRWDEFGKVDTYRRAEMGMESRENRFADEAQELKQLEELYDDAKLASRTQDVVLGRARRSLAISKDSLQIARRNHEVQMRVTLPNQQRDMDNNLRWMKADHANAAWRDEVAVIQQAWSLDASREVFESAEELVAELEEDAASLNIKAEQAGVMTAISLEAGDKVSANQSLAKLFHASKGTIKASVSTKDLRVMQEGDAATVAWDWFGEINTTGKVRHIAWQGTAGGANEAKYDVTIDVANIDAAIRPGMTARITVTKQLSDDTLSVPADAMATDDEGTYCMVKVGDTFERRTVLAGAGNDERVQIIKGLSAGESVRIPAKHNG